MSHTLLLIDAMSIAYRAFHAIADLSTASGRPTNAVYGFIKILSRIERIWSSTHCVVVFDGGRPQIRIDLLAEYKAQRPAMPDALREQLDGIKEYLACANIRQTRMDGEEADDVIASIVAQASSSGMSSLIVTGDKDLMQIVDEHASILLPGGADSPVGPDQVFEKTGVKPCQIVDWLAMIGDNSDNIPGVPGVGAKTAAKWLNQWGSTRNIWSHLNELMPARQRSSLAENRDVVARNIRMMTLNRMLDYSISLDEMKRGTPDMKRLLGFYEKMEFHSLARGLRAPSLF